MKKLVSLLLALCLVLGCCAALADDVVPGKGMEDVDPACWLLLRKRAS